MIKGFFACPAEALAKAGFFVVLLLPTPALAWNGSDHQLQGRLSLQEVSADWGLKEPVSVHPLSSFLQKLPPELNQKHQFSEWLKVNPKTDWEAVVPELEGKPIVTALQILSYYSIDPDDGRDQDLYRIDENGRPRYLYPDQKWFGSMIGNNSQAFRHLEKPPFSFKHPIATFGIPFRPVGEATDRAQIWFLLSQLAFSLEEDYWGWRFLANSFHYLQDLHNPYHAAQITPGLLVKGLWNYLSWGRKELGLMPTFARLVSNSHRFYETYVSEPHRLDHGAKEKALKALFGREIISGSFSTKALAVRVRNESNLLFPDLVSAVTDATQPFLLKDYLFVESDFDPKLFLNKGKEFKEANQKIFEITQERFQSTGRVLRTVVRLALDERDQKKSADLMEALNRILGRP